jgi:nicotinate-nucleotide adenylyltransferase
MRRFITLPFLLPSVVGILGGSFNPAHAGHMHISREACKRLGIRHIWWMVSPQNPLKSAVDMADFSTRLTHAKLITKHERACMVTDIEQKLASQYTIDTLKKLKKRFPRTRFVWLMGADNLANIHCWEQWQQIFTICPILVLDRSPMSHSALRSKAAIRYKKQRINEHDTRFLPSVTTPAWVFSHIRRHPESASAIRKILGKNAFIVHNDR